MSHPDVLTQSERLAAFYPSLTFDLTEDTKGQFDQIVPQEAIDSFSNCLGLPPESGRAILLDAANTYFSGIIERFEQRSAKQDNAALSKVAAKAEQLESALLELVDHPNLETQLEDRIRGFHALAETPNGLSLPDLIGTRRKIFHHLQDMLVDLQACAEATRNHQPKKEDYSNEYLFGDRPNAQEQYELDTEAWKRRSQARKLGRDHPLQCFLRSVLPHWQSNSNLPFTEGMYFKELQENLSATIATLHPIVERIDTEITPQRVASTIRKLREDGKL
ncbi:hypothetical protein ACFP4H_23795 [Pseudophaeobacter arcticus]